MTATIPVQQRTRYRGVIYGIDVIDHASRLAGAPVIVPNDYIGKTRQRGRLRENQHRDTQPFADLIVGSPRVLWEGIRTEDELDAMERRFIKNGANGVRPRLNVELNDDNPRMIPKRVQREQRWQRDDTAGLERWQPADQRTRESLLEWPDQPVRVSGTRPGGQVSEPSGWCVRHPIGVKVCLWLTVWLATAVLIWAYLDRHGWLPDPQVRAVTAMVGGLVLLGWALWRRPDTWKLWRVRMRTARTVFRKARRALR